MTGVSGEYQRNPYRPKQRARWAVRVVFCLLVLVASLTPALLSLQTDPPDVDKVQEMRVLAPLPGEWQGGALDLDKNFVAFDKWFNDHLAYRSWMIRFKNQLDYSLFRTSSRVYFGAGQEIYGRILLDDQLPAVERVFAQPGVDQRIRDRLLAMSAQIKAEGATMILVTPMQRQHFSQKRLPFFAPHMQEPSHFLGLYESLRATPGLEFVDVLGTMKAIDPKYPLYFKQDFHWSDFSAREVSIEITKRIAALEGREFKWRYPLETMTKPEVGSDARFAALLTERPVDELRVDNRPWPAVHQINYEDPAKTGLEYVTDELDDPALLPSTCLFGNSFSDGMVSVGLLNHFQKLTRLHRDGSIDLIPERVRGRCRYVIVQLLDVSPAWATLAQTSATPDFK
ncbi:hypothetical protein [Stenotrophomonas sp.]|uniref:alginate O-acetyltransferase AlgX-related protein n=1 Tax=Stenotrophomonas sp. TaxID=69392 RepID=UPI002898FCE6|nr:hypothetical protein [Stenotrophomonas sp.]